jgi:hypothetical protein
MRGLDVSRTARRWDGRAERCRVGRLTMAYQSGQFSIPGLVYRPVPQAVACFNEKLWVIGNDGNGNMVQSTLTLEQDGQGGKIELQDGDAAVASNWTSSAVDIPPTGTPAEAPATRSRCAATPLDDTLYLFWNNVSLFSALTLMASSYTLTGKHALKWRNAITLQATSGAALQPSYGPAHAEVAATPFGTETVIVACARMLNPSGPDAVNIYVGTFNVNDIDPRHNAWKARGEVWIPLKVLQETAPTPGIRDLGHQISIDWFHANAGPNADLPFWLWVSLTPYSGPDQAGAMLVPLDAKGNPFPSAINGGYRFYDWRSPYGYCAVRDPAGRMRTYSDYRHEGKLVISTYNTGSAPDL